MNNKYLILKLVSNNKTLELGNENYKIVDLEGIESAEFEINLVSNTQYDGSHVDSKRINKRPIFISADFKGVNKETERKKLVSFFNPKNTGILIIDYCGLERSIEYEIEAFDSKINNIYDQLNFQVDLICPDPFFKNTDESKEEVALWVGDFEFPLEIGEEGIEIEHREPSLIVNIFNDGDVECGIRVEFKALATIENPSIVNVNTQEFIKINKTMQAGEIISVSTYAGNKKVESSLNGVTVNDFNYIDFESTFLQLQPGDNLMRYDAAVNIDNLEVTIYYMPLYLGV
ncbi:phage tail family protein [Clostridium sp. DL1XJH146]